MKDFRTIDEQLEILKSRGMIIEDEEFAKNKLEENNYYNVINGYKDSFIDHSKGEKIFFSDVTFEQILLYIPLTEILEIYF